LVRNIDDRIWSFALTGIDDGTKEKVFKNMSKHRVKTLLRDMSTMGSVSSVKINEARKEIIKFVRSNDNSKYRMFWA